MHRIKTLYIFVPNPGEIYQSGNLNIAFFAKLRPIQRHGSPKTDVTVKNGIFW